MQLVFAVWRSARLMSAILCVCKCVCAMLITVICADLRSRPPQPSWTRLLRPPAAYLVTVSSIAWQFVDRRRRWSLSPSNCQLTATCDCNNFRQDIQRVGERERGRGVGRATAKDVGDSRYTILFSFFFKAKPPLDRSTKPRLILGGVESELCFPCIFFEISLLFFSLPLLLIV